MYTGRVQIQSNGTSWESLRVVVPSGRGFLTFSLASCVVNPSTFLFWREKPPGTPLLDGFKLVDEWRIMPCTKISVPLLILDSPGTTGTLHPTSRIMMGKLSGSFSAAMLDTQTQSLCHRYDFVTPCVGRTESWNAERHTVAVSGSLGDTDLRRRGRLVQGRVTKHGPAGGCMSPDVNET